MTVKILLSITDRRTQQVSKLLGKQQHQKLSLLGYGGLNGQLIGNAPAAPKSKLKFWIVFVLSCVAWLVVDNRSSIASPVPSHKELGILRLQPLPIQPSQSVDNSELGRLRLQQIGNSELGRLRLQQIGNLEIGRLRVRQLEFQLPKLEAQSSRPSQPTVRLIGQVGYFQSNNIFSGVDPTDGGLISTSLALWATPVLGPKTSVITAIDGSLIAYIQQSEFSYSQLRFRAGIRQELMPRMYGELGWNNQQLFRAETAGRFLNEHSIRLALYRQDRFTDRLRLDSFYEFRLSFADPESRSRIINSLLISLSYYLQNNLQVGIDYQFGLSKFTQREREDRYQRLLSRLTYALSRNSQVSVQGGLSLGDSSDPNINFNDFFFSISYTVQLGKF